MDQKKIIKKKKLFKRKSKFIFSLTNSVKKVVCFRLFRQRYSTNKQIPIIDAHCAMFFDARDTTY